MKVCKNQLVAILATVILLSACKGGNESNSPGTMLTDTVKSDAAREFANVSKQNENTPVSSNAAVAKANDSIIRTADLKFKVKQVFQASTAIEDIATHFGGFVTTSTLNSSIDQVNITEVSADSSLETTRFTVTSNLVLRVPNTCLDTTLKSMAYLIDYLDYRNIKAEDSRLQFLQSQLSRNRILHHTRRVENNIDIKGKKLPETTDAEDNLLNKQEQADNALLESLTLKDKVNYSTIMLNIYQRQGIKRELIANNKNIEPFKPSFFKHFVESLYTGWIVMEEIMLFFVSIWGFILVALVAYLIYRKYFRKNKV